jgi:hypothetical protein
MNPTLSWTQKGDLAIDLGAKVPTSLGCDLSFMRAETEEFLGPAGWQREPHLFAATIVAASPTTRLAVTLPDQSLVAGLALTISVPAASYLADVSVPNLAPVEQAQTSANPRPQPQSDPDAAREYVLMDAVADAILPGTTSRAAPRARSKSWLASANIPWLIMGTGVIAVAVAAVLVFEGHRANFARDRALVARDADLAQRSASLDAREMRIREREQQLTVATQRPAPTPAPPQSTPPSSAPRPSTPQAAPAAPRLPSLGSANSGVGRAYGAIAVDTSQRPYSASSMTSAEDARQRAMALCREKTSSGYCVVLDQMNTCIAVARGSGVITREISISFDYARRAAMAQCQQSGIVCRIEPEDGVCAP